MYDNAGMIDNNNIMYRLVVRGAVNRGSGQPDYTFLHGRPFSIVYLDKATSWSTENGDEGKG